MNHLKRCRISNLGFLFIASCDVAGGTGVTLVLVPTKTARCHSDTKGRRPFDVPLQVVDAILPTDSGVE